MKTSMMWSAAGLAAMLIAGSATAKDLNGAGGTAIYPVLAKWSDAYKKATGIAVNYQAIGSGGGIQQITAKTVDFANSDKPLTPADLAKIHTVQFPAVIISITPVVNLPGIKPGELTLSGPVLADIYLGKIADWDDPAIAKLNPGVKLPHLDISTVHRSDGSGTTFNFTNYLGKVSPEWQQKVGSDVSVDWPNGVGGKGNAGVASMTQQINGSIGYVEYAYVMDNHMTYTKMINAAGKTLDPTMDAFSTAAANADFSKVQDFYLILTNQPGDKSWPITAATYMLMRTDYPADRNQAVLKFLDWCLKKGQSQAAALDYVPLPPPVVAQIEASWAKSFKGQDGKPIWTASLR
ncbi:MAG TPA: phosphate ABC transporter substrate-binding protein PstS [Stellaceae bacterium]|nr:phosphate ABC transporter substrate-binding protein PstS [Stellaceae bacterium]